MTQSVARGLLWLLVVALLVQFYAAGVGLIAERGMQFHAMLGWSIALATLLALVLTIAATPGRTAVLSVAAAFVLIAAQPALVLVVRRHVPLLGALHAVDGVLALWFLLTAIRSMSANRLRPVMSTS